jgi:hypothetical protein
MRDPASRTAGADQNESGGLAFTAHIGRRNRRNATLNALAIEVFNDLLKKHGKKQTVENPLAD